MNYKLKYLKYKRKYLELKNLYGGSVPTKCSKSKYSEEKLVICDKENNRLSCIKDGIVEKKEDYTYYTCSDEGCKLNTSIKNEQDVYYCDKYSWLKYGFNGMVNLGNTCYGNSFMQPLLFSYPITFEYLNNKKKWVKNDYIKKYINFLELKFSSNEVFNSNTLSSLLHPSGKEESLMCFEEGYGQQDSQEFLSKLLNQLSESELELYKQKNNNVLDIITLCNRASDNLNIISKSEINEILHKNKQSMIKEYMINFINKKNIYMDIFNDFLTSKNYNLNKNYCIIIKSTWPKEEFTEVKLPLSFTCNALNMIQLNIESKNKELNIKDMVNDLLKLETLDGDEKKRWEKNNGTYKSLLSYIHSALFTLPNILIFHLKRFKFITNKHSVKINTEVNIKDSLKIDLSDMVLLDFKYEYELYGITCHYGSLLSGHYTSYVRNIELNKPSLNYNHDESWSCYNDSSHTYVSTEFVCNNLQVCAYILYYKKIDNINEEYPFDLGNGIRYKYMK